MENEIAWLRKYFPAPKPVRVWFVPYKKYYGATFDCGKYFLIKIAKRLDFNATVETLYHEWSHCLRFDTYPDHSDSWARAYGCITRKAQNE